MGNNPFRAMFDIRKNELPFAGLMSLYFFLVITSFWILKPIKKSLFIAYYKTAGGFDLLGWHLLGSQAELLAKVLNMAVAALAAVVFTLLCRRFARQQLTLIFSIFFLGGYLFYALTLSHPTPWNVWSFYLFGDLYSTIMLATFFAFMNDSVTPDAAKRIYGLTGFGGVAGGAFGALGVAALVKQISLDVWMIILMAAALAIIAVALAAGKIAGKTNAEAAAPSGASAGAMAAKSPASDGNPALEGARLVFRSRYLLAIVAIVGLYEMVSTIMDFQFTATVEHFVSGENLSARFSRIYTITNVAGMIIQLFFTSLVMTRFGVGAALLVLPAAALGGSGAYLVFPLLWTGSLLNIVDNAFSYSINQSARESLYVPTSRDEKYKAKAFIDMFVQRFAKALAVGLSLLITVFFVDFSAIRWLSLLSMVILLLWILAARYAGKKFDVMTQIKP